jgi:tetratricopeptide (TPR) repeat protein
MQKYGFLALVLWMVGCAAPTPTLDARRVASQQTLELTYVPFYPQQGALCGPTTLAEMLGATGATVPPAQLADRLYLPEREGSLQIELIAQTRQHLRVPYVLAPEWSAIERELHAGHPSLVLLNLGLDTVPVWHYAVVVGVDYAQQNIILRSGQNPRLLLPLDRFDRAWTRAERWALVITLPDHVPVTATPAGWLEAAYAMEAVGKLGEAEQAYEAGWRRWPQESTFAIALANRYYASGDLAAAETVLRTQLRRGDEATLLNNLAQVLLERGQLAEAHPFAVKAVAMGGPLRQAYQATLDAIQMAQSRRE